MITSHLYLERKIKLAKCDLCLYCYKQQQIQCGVARVEHRASVGWPGWVGDSQSDFLSQSGPGTSVEWQEGAAKLNV